MNHVIKCPDNISGSFHSCPLEKMEIIKFQCCFVRLIYSRFFTLFKTLWSHFICVKLTKHILYICMYIFIKFMLVYFWMIHFHLCLFRFSSTLFWLHSGIQQLYLFLVCTFTHTIIFSYKTRYWICQTKHQHKIGLLYKLLTYMNESSSFSF